MRILFLADNFPPERNAQASRVYERACYWVRWGHEVTVVTCAPNFPEGKLFAGYENRWRQVEMMDGIRVVRVKTFIAANKGAALRTLDFVSYFFTALFFGSMERRPDVVVATSPQFFAGIGGVLLGWMQRAPFVLELSDLWPDSIVAVGAMKKSFAIRVLEKMELWMYARARRVIALTQAFRRNLAGRGVRAEKIDVVINGVDLERYRPEAKDEAVAREFGIALDRLVVGYIGTHGMAHALENVLAAAERMRGEAVQFLFVGAGAEREQLVGLAREKGLDNVVFVPAQGKDRIAKFWALSDVALVHLKDTPTFETVIPSKIFEAMGMGLPVMLVSPAGEAKEIVEREGCGVWVAAERPEELAGAVRRWIGFPGERTAAAERALAAAPLYTRERQAREYLESLGRALGQTK